MEYLITGWGISGRGENKLWIQKRGKLVSVISKLTRFIVMCPILLVSKLSLMRLAEWRRLLDGGSDHSIGKSNLCVHAVSLDGSSATVPLWPVLCTAGPWSIRLWYVSSLSMWSVALGIGWTVSIIYRLSGGRYEETGTVFETSRSNESNSDGMFDHLLRRFPCVMGGFEARPGGVWSDHVKGKRWRHMWFSWMEVGRTAVLSIVLRW
jgi:hypothetical protein